MSAMVKVKPSTHARLQEIAKDQHKPMGDVITDLVDRYERELYWQGVRDDYERLKSDPAAWQDYLDELRLLEGGSMDSLANEEPYYTAEEEAEIRAEYARTRGR